MTRATRAIVTATARIAVLWCVCASSIAYAGRRVVLKADGNASAEIKAKTENQVLRLAQQADAAAELGDVTFTDAATAVGCSGDAAQCRDDVVGTMAVDEVVASTVTALPNGDIHVVVRRVPKTGAVRDAQTTILAGESIESSLATNIGPIFGITPKSAPNTTGNGSAIGAPPGGMPSAEHSHAATNSPTEVGERRHSAKPIVGLAVGGAFVALSVILWSQAAATQTDIDAAPTNSPSDFQYLRDLESRGETYANAGNVFLIAGVVVAGVSGYLLWRDRRSSTTQARIAPALFDRGAGIALTVGGIP